MTPDEKATADLVLSTAREKLGVEAMLTLTLNLMLDQATKMQPDDPAAAYAALDRLAGAAKELLTDLFEKVQS